MLTIGALQKSLREGDRSSTAALADADAARRAADTVRTSCNIIPCTIIILLTTVAGPCRTCECHGRRRRRHRRGRDGGRGAE